MPFLCQTEELYHILRNIFQEAILIMLIKLRNALVTAFSFLFMKKVLLMY